MSSSRRPRGSFSKRSSNLSLVQLVRTLRRFTVSLRDPTFVGQLEETRKSLWDILSHPHPDDVLQNWESNNHEAQRQLDKAKTKLNAVKAAKQDHYDNFNEPGSGGDVSGYEGTIYTFERKLLLFEQLKDWAIYAINSTNDIDERVSFALSQMELQESQDALTALQNSAERLQGILHEQQPELVLEGCRRTAMDAQPLQEWAEASYDSITKDKRSFEKEYKLHLIVSRLSDLRRSIATFGYATGRLDERLRWAQAVLAISRSTQDPSECQWLMREAKDHLLSRLETLIRKTHGPPGST